jgi:hypothetical protein
MWLEVRAPLRRENMVCGKGEEAGHGSKTVAEQMAGLRRTPPLAAKPPGRGALGWCGLEGRWFLGGLPGRLKGSTMRWKTDQDGHRPSTTTTGNDFHVS